MLYNITDGGGGLDELPSECGVLASEIVGESIEVSLSFSLADMVGVGVYLCDICARGCMAVGWSDLR